ncbi:MAG TPA: hypothetical protein VGC90_08970, partial [Candidatus Limnocylindrales bacterium]
RLPRRRAKATAPAPNTMRGNTRRTAAELSPSANPASADGSVSLGGTVSLGLPGRTVFVGRGVVGGVAVAPATPPVGEAGGAVGGAGVAGGRVAVGVAVGAVGVAADDGLTGGDADTADGAAPDAVARTDGEGVSADADAPLDEGWTAVVPVPEGAVERGPPGSPNIPAASAKVASARLSTPSATTSRAR